MARLSPKPIRRVAAYTKYPRRCVDLQRNAEKKKPRGIKPAMLTATSETKDQSHWKSCQGGLKTVLCMVLNVVGIARANS